MSQTSQPDDRPDWGESDRSQATAYAEFLAEMTDQWIWLYRSGDRQAGLRTTQYSALLSPERAERALHDPGWEVQIGSGGYGFSQIWQDDDKTATYERFPGEGTELLVLRRDFHGVRPAESEIVEEMRLLFNLWRDRDGTYYYFDDAGNPVKAIVVDEQGVRALKSLVRRYQAAKQAYLALYLDSTHFSEDLPGEEVRWEQKDDQTVLHYYRGARDGLGGPFSRLFGKRLFAPPPIEDSEIWPFEKPPQYHEFVIGVGEKGEEISNTSDPESLANYFGANPGSPHYLTPVYFRRNVLDKYYADSDLYSVEDGYLRCAGLWGLRLDNDQEGYVMVFLGDLGRDIPYEEARYWRSFNIPPPEEGPSKTLISRAFHAQFADPESVDLRFPREYRETDAAWHQAFGYSLFLPLHDDDQHVMGKLHVPIGEGQAEFDEQVLYVAKLVVDSLNEAEIVAAAGPGPAGEKGLAKLERLLANGGMGDPRAVLRPLAVIQGLRSRGAAHRKGSSFDIKTALGELSRREGFKKLLGDVSESLAKLKTFAEESAKS